MGEEIVLLSLVFVAHHMRCAWVSSEIESMVSISFSAGNQFGPLIILVSSKTAAQVLHH
jgi:hypothetical protein